MSETPQGNPELHAGAAELQARFSQLRIWSTRHDKLAKLVEERKFGEAHRLAESLGMPLTRGQVVRVDFSRPRT